MFQFIKMLNGKGGMAEPCRMPTTSGEQYLHGEALVLSASGALTRALENELPSFIAAESYKAPMEGGRPLCCYPVSPDMVFRVPVEEDLSELKVGQSLMLTDDALNVKARTGGKAVVISTENAGKSGDKILVSFK